MSTFDQQLNSTFSSSRKGGNMGEVLAEGANPMQSLDLGAAKRSSGGGE